MYSSMDGMIHTGHVSLLVTISRASIYPAANEVESDAPNIQRIH